MYSVFPYLCWKLTNSIQLTHTHTHNINNNFLKKKKTVNFQPKKIAIFYFCKYCPMSMLFSLHSVSYSVLLRAAWQWAVVLFPQFCEYFTKVHCHKLTSWTCTNIPTIFATIWNRPTLVVCLLIWLHCISDGSAHFGVYFYIIFSLCMYIFTCVRFPFHEWQSNQDFDVAKKTRFKLTWK